MNDAFQTRAEQLLCETLLHKTVTLLRPHTVPLQSGEEFKIVDAAPIGATAIVVQVVDSTGPSQPTGILPEGLPVTLPTSDETYRLAEEARVQAGRATLTLAEGLRVAVIADEDLVVEPAVSESFRGDRYDSEVSIDGQHLPRVRRKVVGLEYEPGKLRPRPGDLVEVEVPGIPQRSTGLRGPVAIWRGKVSEIVTDGPVLIECATTGVGE